MSRDYRRWADYMREKLSDPEKALAYLNGAIEEYEEDGDAEAFLLALRHVTDAQGGISELAAHAGLNRQSLYRALSGKGNPRLDTLTRVLNALGMQLQVKWRVEPQPSWTGQV